MAAATGPVPAPPPQAPATRPQHRPAGRFRWLGPAAAAALLVPAALVDLATTILDDPLSALLGLGVKAAAVAVLWAIRREPRAGLGLFGLLGLVVAVTAFRAVVGLSGTWPPGLAFLVASFLVALWQGARWAPRSWAAGLGAGYLVALVVAAGLMDTEGWPFIALVFWVAAAGIAGTALYLRYLAAERRRSVLDARNAERLEIARELHDLVAHHVTGIIVEAQAGRFLVGTDPARAGDLFADIERAGQAAMASMRQVVAPLRAGAGPARVGAAPPGAPAADGPGPGGPALDLPSLDVAGELRALAAGAERAGARVVLEVGDIPPELGPTVVRLTREALTNVRRHGRNVTSVAVRAGRHDQVLAWSVVDDGAPATGPAGPPGLGLVGLRERVEALGGTFQAGPAPYGWAVQAELPLRPPAPDRSR